MEYSAYSNVGGRGNNEDAMLVEEAGDATLFVVADGVGGVEAGELASNAAIEELRGQFLFEPNAFDLNQAVMAANLQVLNLQEKTKKKMKTTIAVVCVTPDSIQCVHVGDTRIYLLNGDGICYQSMDHSVSQMAVLAGEITADEIRQHKDRNKLLRALGVSDELTVDVKTFPRAEVNGLLMCTDGFWEYVLEQELIDTRKAAESSEEWLCEMRKILQERVKDKENNDNNTAIAASF
ncbi:MAG: serine/threonine-protein phosphatase [Clostridia bacterium]|nr:serine/threonine-protein phosphatase [Clostridia bacterium]